MEDERKLYHAIRAIQIAIQRLEEIRYQIQSDKVIEYLKMVLRELEKK